MPERFPCAGVYVRDAVNRERMAATWPFAFVGSLEELAALEPQFVVTSVSWSSNLPLIEELSSRGVPVLSETPIAPELPDLHRVWELSRQGAKIQLAEEYPFQAEHAARLSLVRKGLLGEIHEADVSCALAYHGIALLRQYLQVGLRLPKISARSFKSQMLAGPGRDGPPKERKLVEVDRVIAELEYGDKLGIFDFQTNQHRSWIRSPRVMVRGEQGEINDMTVRLLQDHRTPLQFDLLRQDTGQGGNMEGRHHRAILGGSEVWYQNPFPGPGWSDDEIAVATCVAAMQRFVETGEEFYGVADACHDRYLDILVGDSIRTGGAIRAEPQPWSE